MGLTDNGSRADDRNILVAYLVVRGHCVVDYQSGFVVELLLGNDHRNALLADAAQAVGKALRLDYRLNAVLDREVLDHLLNVFLSLAFLLVRAVRIKNFP